MTAPSLFVVDYPEAHTAAQHLKEVLGVDVRATLPAHGNIPDAKSLHAHALPAEPFIIVNGSGDYHHETVTFLEAFLRAHPARQFAYVQIDAHPDKDDTFRWKLDCASFVGRVMERDEVHGVTLLGLYPECLDTTGARELVIKNVGYFRVPYFQKLQQFVVRESPIPEIMFRLPPGTVDDAQANASVREATIIEREMPGDEGKPPVLRDGIVKALQVRWRSVDDFDPRTHLPDLPVYLTIDLDVLRERIVTDWRRDPSKHDRTPWGFGDNQGDMDWATLEALILRIGRHRRILGADFCGLTREAHLLPDDARQSSLSVVVDTYRALAAAIAHGGRGDAG